MKPALRMPEEMTRSALDYQTLYMDWDCVDYSPQSMQDQGRHAGQGPALQEDQENFIKRLGECTLWTWSPVSMIP